LTSGFLDEVEAESGIKVSACFQCRKMHQRLSGNLCHGSLSGPGYAVYSVGLKQEVQESATIWVCSSCETCTTRCPNEIDIAGIMDFMKQSVVKEKGQAADTKVLAFHQVFMKDIRKRGGFLKPV